MTLMPTFLLPSLTFAWPCSPECPCECLCPVRSSSSKTELIITIRWCPLASCTVSKCSKDVRLDTKLKSWGYRWSLSSSPISPRHQYVLRTAPVPGSTLRAGRTDAKAALAFQSSDGSSLETAFACPSSHAGPLLPAPRAWLGSVRRLP